MAELNLQRMRVGLIRGGVAPKFVNRTLAELGAHYSDLKSQAVADGLSESGARLRADDAIGDEKILMDEILHKKELKSWLWRYPKSTFLLLPLLILILSIFVFAACFIYIYDNTAAISEMLAGSYIPLWVKVLVESLSFFNFYLLTPMLAIGIILIVKQRMIPLHWPLIGLALLMFVGCGWKYSINWPTEILEGNINIQWGYSFLPITARVHNGMLNLMNMLICISLSATAWWVYSPYERAAENS